MSSYAAIRARKATKLARSIAGTLRSSAHLVQTEIDKALLNLRHAGAARVLESESADMALRLARNVLKRAQEIRESLHELTPTAAVSFAKSALFAEADETSANGAKRRARRSPSAKKAQPPQPEL